MFAASVRYGPLNLNSAVTCVRIRLVINCARISGFVYRKKMVNEPATRYRCRKSSDYAWGGKIQSKVDVREPAKPRTDKEVYLIPAHPDFLDRIVQHARLGLVYGIDRAIFVHINERNVGETHAWSGWNDFRPRSGFGFDIHVVVHDDDGSQRKKPR